MTCEQFLAALREVEADWSTLDTAAGERLRAVFAGEDTEFCPLTAVARVRLRRYFSETFYFEAGVALGLSTDDVEAIQRAADKGSAEPLWHELMLATVCRRQSATQEVG